MTPIGESSPVARGSFRDPSGRVFSRRGRLFRQINAAFAPHYERLIGSGLYRALVDQRLLVPHEEVAEPPERADAGCRVIEPERIAFVSYPFEWAFSQLKAAALTMLRIQRRAIEHGMTLKDASAFNIQFRGAEPVLIDTLSFELWQEGTPWVGYRQFCQHFLGPLALMSRTDIRLGCLSRVFIDGAPLDLVSRLLPFASKLAPSLFVHLHLHARAQVRLGGRALTGGTPKAFGRRSMMGLVDHLQSAIEGLSYEPAQSSWIDYYQKTNYSKPAMADKEHVVNALVERERPRIVWDLGANTGAFSRLASAHGAYTVAFDGDGAAVEHHYVECRARADAHVLPLVMDLTNPTSGIGWSHAERLSLVDRGPADLVLVLGLIHHMCLSNQVPFALVADFLQRIGRTLIIEFVPRTDSQVVSMLSRMPDLRDGYSIDAFEREFARFFNIADVVAIADSERRIYFMQSKKPSS